MTAEADGPFSVYIEWIGVSQNDMNGIPLGYNIYALLNGTVKSSNNTGFEMTGIIMNGLVPSTSYAFKVCAYNSIGDGPCERGNAVTLDSGTLIIVFFKS